MPSVVQSPIARGFTLVEVLVVVLIAGILTGAVLVVTGQSAPAQANKRELARLSASLEMMCDRALLSGSAHGLRFHAEGFDFWQYHAGTWQPLPPDSRPHPARWPQGIRARVQVENLVLRLARNQRRPQIICTGIEPPTSFVIELGRGDDRQSMGWPR